MPTRGASGCRTRDAPARSGCWSTTASLSLRETGYDLEAAVAELRASGFPGVEEMVGDSLLDPADPEWVAAFFEHTVGRGEHPDDVTAGT